MKNFEADQKRLRAIMTNFEEKKPDMADGEKKERSDLIQLCKDCFNLFKMAYNQQTSKMENSGGTYITTTDVSLMAPGEDISKTAFNNSSRYNPRENNETQQAFLDENNAPG